MVWQARPTLRTLLPLLPHEDKREQDDVHSERHDSRDLQTHITRFPEEAVSSLAVGFSDCLVIFCCELGEKQEDGVEPSIEAGEIFVG